MAFYYYASTMIPYANVAFAAARDLYYTHDHRLTGHTSLKALLIYSSAIFFMEGLSVRLQQKHCPLPVRLTIYTLFIYLREFSWGFLLRLFGACPWDYSELRYNFIGLTLKYVVPWALTALIAKKQIIRNTLKIRLDKQEWLAQYQNSGFGMEPALVPQQCFLRQQIISLTQVLE
uniref:Uncharacterized protein n=1 Tax=Cyprinus carpio TaxID=7962 RepID=A0A8C2AZD7_CYPCA